MLCDNSMFSVLTSFPSHMVRNEKTEFKAIVSTENKYQQIKFQNNQLCNGGGDPNSTL